MKFRIHYEIGDYQDNYIVEGDTIEDVREASIEQLNIRGLDTQKNNVWSEELK